MAMKWDWEETLDVEAWKGEARALQKNVFLRLGDREWDEWEKSNKEILLSKIGYGLYPQPENLSGSTLTQYNEEQLKNIELVASVILENAKNGTSIHFACIFIFGKIENNCFFTPVFKVEGKQDNTLFVDSDGSVYENWSDYLNFNHLPKCLYCYPRDGIYQVDGNQVLVDFGSSLECDPNNTTRVICASTSVMFESLFPVSTASPIPATIQVTSARENLQLHDQSTDSDDSEENADWLKIAYCVLSILRSSLRKDITQAAAAGEVAKQESLVYDAVTFSLLTVNGLENLKNIISLVDKVVQGTLKDLDLLHFSESALFFSNNLLKMDTAREIIENTQQQVLELHCNDLTAPQMDEFLQLSQHVQGETQLHKNADKIKVINQIGDKQAFYESLVTARSDLEGHQVQFSFKDLGIININNELHIAPNKLVQISAEDRCQILDATKKVNDFAISDEVYRNKIETILKNNRIKMEYQRREAKKQLKQAFNVRDLAIVKIGDQEIFKNMTPSELDRLADVMKTAAKNYDPRILEIANQFAARRNCKTPRDYCCYVEFVRKYLDDLKKEREAVYDEALRIAKNSGPVNVQTFAKDYGITGKKSVYFQNQVFDDNAEERLNILENLYIKWKSEVLPKNALINPNFDSETSVVYHCFKHSDFGGKELTVDEYFRICSELVNEPLNQRSAQLNQQGNKRIILFTNPINGAKGIVFEALADGKLSIATVFYDAKVKNQSN